MSCKGCAYAVLLSWAWCCNYLLINGHCRPCPPGEACTVRVETEQRWKECPPVKGRTWDVEKARALYEQGLPDGSIAAEVGAARNAIAFWRRKQGLPPNREIRAGSQSPSPVSAPPLPERPLTLPEDRYVELSIKADHCVISLRAPNLEAAEGIYRCAGGLLKDMAQAAKLREGIDNA